MTPNEIAEARRILRLSTPGPWRQSIYSANGMTEWAAMAPIAESEHRAKKDSDLISAARVGWPKTLDALEKLQKDFDEVEHHRNKLYLENIKLAAVASMAKEYNRLLIEFALDNTNIEKARAADEQDLALREALRALENR